MLELLAVCLLGLGALILRRHYLDTRPQERPPATFDRLVKPATSAEPYLSRVAADSGEIRTLLRPITSPDRRSNPVVVEVDGREVGRLPSGDAGRYRARHGNAVTTCRGRVVRPSRNGTHELWLELPL